MGHRDEFERWLAGVWDVLVAICITAVLSIVIHHLP